MTRYPLDTNTLSQLADRPRGSVSRRVRLYGLDAICTSIVVAAELRFGGIKRGSRKLQESLDEILERFEVKSLLPPADICYAELRDDLRRRGTPIGANDMWIAAHALALDCTLVTANTGEFSRVPSLRVENWLAD